MGAQEHEPPWRPRALHSRLEHTADLLGKHPCREAREAALVRIGIAAIPDAADVVCHGDHIELLLLRERELGVILQDGHPVSPLDAHLLSEALQVGNPLFRRKLTRVKLSEGRHLPEPLQECLVPLVLGPLPEPRLCLHGAQQVVVGWVVLEAMEERSVLSRDHLKCDDLDIA